MKNILRNLLKLKKLSNKDLLKKYFNRWKNNILRKKSKDALYKLLAKLITINAKNFKKKILAKNLILGEIRQSLLSQLLNLSNHQKIRKT